jgi:hypothetical protein
MAKFRAGHAKPENSGRQKGVPNRKTLILKEALDQLGHDLPTKITDLLPQLPPDKQMDVYLELMQYVYPRRKAVELSGHDGGPIEVTARNGALKRILADPDAMSALEILEAKLGDDDRTELPR